MPCPLKTAASPGYPSVSQWMYLHPHHNDLQLLLEVIICLYFGKTMSILQTEKPMFLAVNSRRSQPEACMSNLKLGPCASVDETVHRGLYV